MNPKCLLFVFLLIIQFLSAQKSIYKIPDSLKGKSYEYLDEKIYAFKADSSSASVYLYTYLQKSLHENNTEETINAYQNLLHQSPKN